MSPELHSLFRAALHSEAQFRSLQELAGSLARGGMPQPDLYTLFSWYQQRLSPEDPSYDAVVDTMEHIYGGPWAKGSDLYPHQLAESDARIPAPARPACWLELTGGDGRLEAEARREIGQSHPLWGMELVALERRVDNDDVVFGVRRRPEVWLVHLTWSGTAEVDGFPRSTRFATMLEWFEHVEAAAHDETT